MFVSAGLLEESRCNHNAKKIRKARTVNKSVTSATLTRGDQDATIQSNSRMLGQWKASKILEEEVVPPPLQKAGTLHNQKSPTNNAIGTIEKNLVQDHYKKDC